MVGGGALAAIGTAGVAYVCWQFGFPAFASSGGYRLVLVPAEPSLNVRGLYTHSSWHAGKSDAYRIKADEHLAVFWMYVMQPVLFCTIGTTVNIANIPGIIIPKALLVIVVGEYSSGHKREARGHSLVLFPSALLASGSVARIIAAYCSTLPTNWTRKEVLFVALSWIPKATVQGALSSGPLDAVNKELGPSAPNYDEYETWGQQILATAVLAIFVTAPMWVGEGVIVGVMYVRSFSPIILGGWSVGTSSGCV